MTGLAPFVVGIAGWKNSGKTTLVVKLVKELTRRGYRVSTVKHSHHDVELDAPETDSARHREAGARDVVLVSPHRWALMHELRGEPEPPLEDVIDRLIPTDIVLVEGYKHEPIFKIEVRRTTQQTGEPLAGSDPLFIAIAADHAVQDATVPVLDLNDIEGLAALLLSKSGIPVK
jgi:molybdopterin-guanine dinucleotide biosynthesis protein B